MKKAEAAAVQDPPPAVVSDPFDGVAFALPFGEWIRHKLAPFVRHADGCAALAEGNDACACGLRPTVLELQRREILMQRYGSVE